MNRREADPGIWYDIDDQRLYGSEYLPVAIGPFTFENAYSTRWYAPDSPLNPIWFATDATARKVAELVNAFFGPGSTKSAADLLTPTQLYQQPYLIFELNLVHFFVLFHYCSFYYHLLALLIHLVLKILFLQVILYLLKQ